MAFKQQLPFKLPFSTLPNVELSKKPNKIVYGNNVLIDLTNDTVKESDVLKGVTFHKADGTLAVGTLEI